MLTFNVYEGGNPETETKGRLVLEGIRPDPLQPYSAIHRGLLNLERAHKREPAQVGHWTCIGGLMTFFEVAR